MTTSPERVAELERANYAAMLPSARVTPGVEVVLRDDVILTSSASLPSHDSNHACLLRTSAERVDKLIAEVIAFFQAQERPVAIYVSPACKPPDLPDRLLEKGFNEQEEESWMVLEDLSNADIPRPYPGYRVGLVSEDEAELFAGVFLAAFGMPSEFAPIMAQLLRPSIGLPSVRHYVARDGAGEAIGTCSLLLHESFGVLGSAGVVSDHRRNGAATSLAVRAATDAIELGVDTLMLQTAADTWLERFLRISGFERAFIRSCYIRDDGSSR